MPNDPIVQLAPWQWWSNFGVLGVLMGVAVFAAWWWLREWWSVRKPYLIAKQDVDLKNAETLTLTVGVLVGDVAKLKVQVETMWNFMLRRGMSEGIEKGLGTLNSPFIVSPDAVDKFGSLANDIRVFFGDKPGLNEHEIALHLERSFGERILKEVCVPHKLAYGACLIVAIAIARGTNIVELSCDEATL
jgi:hypothetical protein